MCGRVPALTIGFFFSLLYAWRKKYCGVTFRRLYVRVQSSLWLNRAGIPTILRSRATDRRKNTIRTLHFGMSGSLRPWRCRVARPIPLNPCVRSTGVPRSLPPFMTSILGSREDPKLALVGEMLRRRETVRLELRGTSMLPSLWPGDLLTIQSAAYDELVPGDIVLVLRDNRFFVHRLVERRQDQDCIWWITTGRRSAAERPPASRIGPAGPSGREFAVASAVSFRAGELSRLYFALAWMLCRWDRFRSLALRIHAAHMQAGASHP